MFGINKKNTKKEKTKVVKKPALTEKTAKPKATFSTNQSAVPDLICKVS